jgi:transposase InsO family protein/transposase-like protein
MDEKMKFVAAVNTQLDSFAEVCREFGISRKSGYALMRRYEQEGAKGLLARSRAPHTHPNAMEEAMVEQLLQIKQRYPRMGPGKVLDRMRMQGHDAQVLPARSSVGELFKRHGLVRPRKPRAATAPRSAPLSHAVAPNALWSVDFKGQFRLGNGRWCYPLTVSDNASRYLLVCRGMEHPTERGVWPHLELAFREFGLPRAMRSDNGSPFASTGLAGLTRLSVWWLKLGIGLERIAPGHPEQNARHERMHRTLREDIEQPRLDLAAQQRRLNWFQHYYNEERPHDSLDGVPPAHRYSCSPRPYPRRVREPEYPVGFTVRQVRSNGQIKWQGHTVFVAEALIGEPVALRQIAEDYWQVWFCHLKLGLLNTRRNKIERLD